MTQCENDFQLYPKGDEEKNEFIKNHQVNLDLKVIKESEENCKNNEEEHLSEEDTLGYNSNYKAHKNNMGNKEYQNIKEKTSKRKASTLSTTISLTDTFSEINSFLPPANIKSQNFDRKASYTQSPHIFFGRERLNSTPITTYYEGLDFYLRGLQPEKNEYQNSNNYIEKEIFFKERNIPYKDNKYKSFDMAEQKMFNSNQILKNLEENYNKTASDKKISSSNILENNSQNTKNNNNQNNNQNNFIQINPKFNNCIYGKFDMPMYYFGYYNLDCKFYIFKLFL